MKYHEESIPVRALTNATYIGGALGWKVRGSLHGDFEKVAYELEPSTTGNPQFAEVKTSHGYVRCALPALLLAC